ncbi:MAG: YbjQ family protein [Ferrimicrobium sp.]|nr:YbjQ family protein [Ferrimicrobium sp.]
MIVTSSCDLPGYRIEQVIGPVFGLTVRSRNAFSQAGAGFKSMFGGELKGMTKNLEDSRSQVIERMEAKAEELGANAVVAFRFDTSDMGGTWTEICAYGTAVVAALLSA